MLKDEDEYSVRHEQVLHRAREASRALDLMLDLGKKSIENLLDRSDESQDLYEAIANVMDARNPGLAGV